ncbi:hypothetical protein D3C81_1352270 [compost metagenome]
MLASWHRDHDFTLAQQQACRAEAVIHIDCRGGIEHQRSAIAQHQRTLFAHAGAHVCQQWRLLDLPVSPQAQRAAAQQYQASLDHPPTASVAAVGCQRQYACRRRVFADCHARLQALCLLPGPGIDRRRIQPQLPGRVITGLHLTAVELAEPVRGLAQRSQLLGIQVHAQWPCPRL